MILSHWRPHWTVTDDLLWIESMLSMIMSVDAIKLKVHFMRCIEAMFDWTCLRFHCNYVLLMWRDNYIVIISYIYHTIKNYIIFNAWIINCTCKHNWKKKKKHSFCIPSLFCQGCWKYLRIMGRVTFVI